MCEMFFIKTDKFRMIQQWVHGTIVIHNKRDKMFASFCCDNATENVNHRNGDLTMLCICKVIAPVIRFCQFFGMFPAKFPDAQHSQQPQFHVNDTCSKSCWNFKSGIVGGISVDSTDKYDSQACQLTSRLMSFPSISNIFFMLSFAGVTAWTFSQLGLILTVYFEGTDLYTYGTQTICLYTQANIVLINAFFQREKFCKIWALFLKILRKLTKSPASYHPYQIENEANTKLTPLVPPSDPSIATVASALLNHLEIMENTNVASSNSKLYNVFNYITSDEEINKKIEKRGCTLMKRFRILRIFSYICIITIILLSISHIVSFFNLVFYACFNKAADPGVNGVFGKPPCPLTNFLLLLQKCFYGMIDFIKRGAAVLFGTFCLLIYLYFREVEEQLDNILRNFGDIKKPANSIQCHYQIEHLRLCYEDLSQVCRLMSSCFGLPVLSILITAAISITCALYSFAMYSGAIVREESIDTVKFYVIWAFHGWFDCFCLILVLIPGQLITNASDAPSQVIGRHSLVYLDEESKYQLSQFQHQCRQPIIITACNIVNVGLSFIAAATTNVTTYILVILQFRLGVEKSA